MSEGESSSGEEELECYSNDPLGQQGEKTPTPKVRKGPGRPRKGQKKIQIQTKKKYNTRNRVSITKAMATAVTISSAQFQVDDAKLATCGMTTFKSWADECDTELTPPKHSDTQVN